MAISKKALRDALRSKYVALVSEMLEKEGEEILTTNSNEIAIPCVDEVGNEEFLVLTFKIPTGSRDGEIYDGYAVARDYEMKQTAKAEKAKAAAEKKEAKIKRDEAMRQAKKLAHANGKKT